MDINGNIIVIDVHSAGCNYTPTNHPGQLYQVLNLLLHFENESDLSRFRDAELSEEELCSLMEEFVKAAQQGKHKKEGWPTNAYYTTKIGVTVLSRIQARVLSQTRAGDGILLNACCPGWVRTDMAGPKAPKSPDKGAETPVYLALLPRGDAGPHGQLVWDKEVQEW